MQIVPKIDGVTYHNPLVSTGPLPGHLPTMFDTVRMICMSCTAVNSYVKHYTSTCGPRDIVTIKIEKTISQRPGFAGDVIPASLRRRVKKKLGSGTVPLKKLEKNL